MIGVRSDQLVARAVACAKEGDLSALHFLYVRYVDDVAERVQSVVGDPQAADEITQELFARLVETIGEHQTIEDWLIRAAHIAATDAHDAVHADSDDDRSRPRTNGESARSGASLVHDRVEGALKDPDDPSRQAAAGWH